MTCQLPRTSLRKGITQHTVGCGDLALSVPACMCVCVSRVCVETSLTTHSTSEKGRRDRGERGRERKKNHGPPDKTTRVGDVFDQ